MNNEEFKSMNHYHHTDKYEVTVLCKECGDELIQEFANDHICPKEESKHSQPDTFECPICKQDFRSEQECSDHI